MLSSRMLLLLIMIVAAGSAQASSTALYMQSQRGDYVGAGAKYAYVAPTDTITLTGDLTGITVTVNQSGPAWTLYFAPPKGARLADGVYEGAQSGLANAPDAPEMSVGGEGRGCGYVNGRFEIFHLKTDNQGVPLSFVLQFEQHCEGWQPALFGQLLYNAGHLTGPLVSVAPGTARKGNAGTSDGVVALSLSRPRGSRVSVSYATADGNAKAGRDYVATQGTVTFPRGTTTQYIDVPVIGDRHAASGRSFKVMLTDPVGVKVGAESARTTIIDPNAPLTVLALNSQPGDGTGEGVQWLITPADASFSTSLQSGVAQVQVFNFPISWNLAFAAPSGEALVPGFYPNAQHWPGTPPNVPGLGIGMFNQSCDPLTGNFTINELSAADGTFSADFQQNCGTNPAGLFGSIRINQVLQQLSVTNAVIDGNRAKFTITVNPVSTVPVSATFATADGTAKAGVDYTAVSTLVTIPAGTGEASVSVKLSGRNSHGKSFYGTITPTSFPASWLSSGVARP